jgi:hypothetical protein
MSKKIYITESQLDRIVEFQRSDKCAINESFKSNELRDFILQHGGVNRKWYQGALGDISDKQIGYFEAFDSYWDAYETKHKLTASNKYTHARSPYDMQYLFKIFVANDGAAALVGIDRDKIETGVTWGGETTKKLADRYWNNGYNFNARDYSYSDDRDKYYYHSPAKDFGLSTSRDYKGRLSDINMARERMSPEDYKNWRKERAERVPEYMSRNHPYWKERLNAIRAPRK